MCGERGELGSKAGLEDSERIPRLGVRPSAPGDGVGRRLHRGAHQGVPPSSRPGYRSPRGGACGRPRAERPRRGLVCGPGGLRDRRGDWAAAGWWVRSRPVSERESAPAPAPPPGAPRPHPEGAAARRARTLDPERAPWLLPPRCATARYAESEPSGPAAPGLPGAGGTGSDLRATWSQAGARALSSHKDPGTPLPWDPHGGNQQHRSGPRGDPGTF